MKNKWVISAVLAAFLILEMNSGSEAASINEKGINEVLAKEVLNKGDLRVIDDFVREAVRKLLRAKDFASIAKVRTVILSKKSDQSQYAGQFSKSAYKYISEALDGAGQITSEDRKRNVILNLLILIDGLEDLRLVDLAIKLLNDEKHIIRYWAVHSITNPGIVKKLNSSNPTDSELASGIAAQLKGLVERSGYEILALISEFAAKVNVVQGEELLLQIADTRIGKYADWTVDYELLDAGILKLLCAKMGSPSPNRAAVARRFGQLYSYAIDRYVKGRDFLSVEQKHHLASVLVEVEDKCIRELIERQTKIKTAVERHDYMALLDERSRLLGDETGRGQLALKFNFDYGTNPGGNKRTAPFALPEPPKTEKQPAKQGSQV